MAQCSDHSDSWTVKGQADVEPYSNCNSRVYYLTIQTNETSIDLKNSVSEAGGYVAIVQSPNLVNLSATALVFAGLFEARDQPSLQTVSFSPSFSATQITCTNDPSLQYLSFFAASALPKYRLAAGEPTLYVSSMEKLASLNYLSQGSAAGDIDISYNPNMQNAAITFVESPAQGQLYVESNGFDTSPTTAISPAASFLSLRNLTGFLGSITVTGNAFHSIDATQLRQISGYNGFGLLEISNNYNLTSLDISALEYSENIKVTNNTNLRNISIPILKNVANLKISGNVYTLSMPLLGTGDPLGRSVFAVNTTVKDFSCVEIDKVCLKYQIAPENCICGSYPLGSMVDQAIHYIPPPCSGVACTSTKVGIGLGVAGAALVALTILLWRKRVLLRGIVYGKTQRAKTITTTQPEGPPAYSSTAAEPSPAYSSSG